LGEKGVAGSSAVISLIDLAQFLNAMAGAWTMSLPAKLSAVWFPEKERSTATAIAVVSNSLGAACGYLGPYFPSISSYLAVQLALSSSLLVCFLIHFPYKPMQAPSATSGDETEPMALWSAVKDISSNVPAMIIAIFGGLAQGIYNGWSPSLDSIIAGDEYGDKEVALFGLIYLLSYMVGCITIGPIVDRFDLRRKQKHITSLSTVAAGFFLLLLAFSLPALGDVEPVIPSNFGSIATLGFLASLFLGMCCTVLYELIAEVTYPHSPELIAIAMASFFQIGALIFLGLKNIIPKDSIGTIGGLATLLSGMAVALAKEKYFRADADDAAKLNRIYEPLITDTPYVYLGAADTNSVFS